ncbi:hypothetical protein [Pontibacter sp. G13]|uniref:hypothetical protein n=1 Tax=Pontibacter sp. G13 TaxID=3074898 RepID=UPI00288C35A8|nr:hypothetical protein [Pontibacter sp. G13]WNJ18533.1 hypothetical protein RJD25_27065 [Pontibacter sp. G13]
MILHPHQSGFEWLESIVETAKWSIQWSLPQLDHRPILDLLIDRAHHGIAVSLLVSSLDLEGTISHEQWEKAVEAGIEISVVLPTQNPPTGQLVLELDHREVWIGAENWHEGMMWEVTPWIQLTKFQQVRTYRQFLQNRWIHSTPFEPGNEGKTKEVQFSISQQMGIQGEPFQMVWNALEADSVDIQPSFGKVEQQGKRSLVFQQSQTFVLTAQFGERIVRRTVHIDPLPTPNILFQVSANWVTKGELVTVTWQVQDAFKLEIQPWGEVESTGQKTWVIQEDTALTLVAQGAVKEHRERILIRTHEAEIPREVILANMPEIRPIAVPKIQVPTPDFSIAKLPDIPMPKPPDMNWQQIELPNWIPTFEMPNSTPIPIQLVELPEMGGGVQSSGGWRNLVRAFWPLSLLFKTPDERPPLEFRQVADPKKWLDHSPDNHR